MRVCWGGEGCPGFPQPIPRDDPSHLTAPLGRSTSATTTAALVMRGMIGKGWLGEGNEGEIPSPATTQSKSQSRFPSLSPPLSITAVSLGLLSVQTRFTPPSLPSHPPASRPLISRRARRDFDSSCLRDCEVGRERNAIPSTA